MPSEPAYRRAVVTVDAHKARIVRINAEAHHARLLEVSTKSTAQHNAEVRHTHEFFAAVCDDLAGLDQVLVTGGHTGLAEFKHYVTSHRPALVNHIVGYETINHPTEAQLVAYGRDYFEKIKGGVIS